MRLAPTIIAGHQDLAHAVELAWLSGRETHYSEVAECGTEVFANLLFRALKFRDKSAIVRLDNLYFTSDALRECWLDNSWLVENRIESDGECLRRATVFTDTTEALMKAGDLLGAIEEGAWAKDQLAATLEQLCRSQHPGRRSAEEITLFKSVGSALEDLAAASLAYDGWLNHPHHA